MSFKFHLITNVGTLIKSPLAIDYPSTLALAHIYAKHPAYANTLKMKIRVGHRVILDNGAHEGIDIDLAEYAKVITDLAPSVVVMTDLINRPREESRKRSFELFDHLAEFQQSDAAMNTQFMYVAQGTSKQEVLDEYEWAINELDPVLFIIGLGNGYLHWVRETGDENKEETRMPMVGEVLGMPGAEDHEFHVLGARWSADNSDYAYFENISGIDTIKPCTCASSGLVYPTKPPFRCMDRESLDTVDSSLLEMNILEFCADYGCENELGK